MKRVRIQRKTTVIQRPVLYGMLSLKYKSYIGFEKTVGISARTVGSWVSNLCQPRNDESWRTALKHLNLPEHVLLISRNTNSPAAQFERPECPKAKMREGVKDKRFRETKCSTIKHPVLYSLLIGYDIKISELAAIAGVTPRAASSWIYEGSFPKKTETISAIEDFFALPIEQIMLDKEIIPYWF